ncbi:MAG: TetR/AcrR family transcriptional regulator, partial [Pseudobdellovibrionaceae bacterium]
MDDQKTERQNAYGTSKDQILRAAENLFARQGFSCTTLKDVARESGANTALVGYHFGSKDGLRQAVIESQLNSVQKTLSEVLPTNLEMNEQVFRDLLSKYLFLARSEANYYRTVLWSILDGAELGAFVFEKFAQPLLEQMKDFIRRLNPKIEAYEVETRAIFILGQFLNYAKFHWHDFQHLKTESCPEKIKEHY